ncbi:DUF6090 family protein [Seonamhaeicola sp. MEBiC1930]|uniref:DUF6090 family protein n=1 Tax=Seonamhaeicola sp. MEBiC01930 TaxID=2976768 RepID=UPI0032560ADC
MEKNKFTTYLLYASGEIVLVVIGILLAVNINDWKHSADDSELEVKILKEIKTDLENDLNEIRNELGNFKHIQKGDSILIEFYNSSKPFTDSLGALVYLYEISPHFNPINGGYQLLKAKGIDLIKNDQLRLAINSYYELSIPYYRKYEEERIQIIQNEMVPFNNDFFRLERFPSTTYWKSWKRMPFDENALKKNQKWLAIIQKSNNLAAVLFKKAESHEKKIITLIQNIEKELIYKS